MAKVRTVFRCGQCGATTPKWAGRCTGCEAWNTLAEEALPDPAALGVAAASLLGPPRSVPVPIHEGDPQGWQAGPTGWGELDRVLGGGVLPGSVTLLGGEPGVGKSTLLLQLGACLAAGGTRVLYVSGEESTQQVRLRAERLGALPPELWLVAETLLPHVLAHIDDLAPGVVLVDSIQTLCDPALTSAAGSVGQVRECSARLVIEAKARGTAVWLVGHVTKDGALAGPRLLEHVVDTVLAFEGDRHHSLRLLRATKHRFGATDQVGVFEMTGAGLEAVGDPSRFFLADRRDDVPGSVVAPVLDGRRPLLVEVQALVGPAAGPVPRRSAQGLDPGRLATVLAVLDRRPDLPLGAAEVHALAAGGVKVVEPAADLAVALALVSSATGVPLPADVVAFGEVGLGSELRQVTQGDRRLAEAARLGFRRAIVPRSVADGPDGVTVLRASTVGEAVGLAGLPLP
jgi:DNA repair protein RadA/Sms